MLRRPDVARRKYDAEFKRNAVELLLSGDRDLKPLAAELGVSAVTLRAWRDRYLRTQGESPQGPPRGPTSLETAQELRRLRQENEHLKRQREILKKALGILSDPPQGGMS